MAYAWIWNRYLSVDSVDFKRGVSRKIQDRTKTFRKQVVDYGLVSCENV